MATEYKLSYTASEIDEKLGKVGIQPDWNQSDSTQIDYIKNRTHYMEPNKDYFHITEDMIKNPLDSYVAWESDYCYKVSDLVSTDPLVENLVGITVTERNEDGEETVLTSNKDNIYDGRPDDDMGIYITFDNYDLNIILEDYDSEIDDSGTIKTVTSGIWIYVYGEHNPIVDIEVPSEIPVRLDEKYLPKSVAGKNVAGKSFIIDDEEVVATIGAEIFNDYDYNIATGYYCHAEGSETTASGNFSHAEGRCTQATGDYSHAEGQQTQSTGDYSHAEGWQTDATGDYSHAEGNNTKATGNMSHAEGVGTQSTGDYSHAEGYVTEATGNYSHAEGYQTEATGNSSHAEGCRAQAVGYSSHAEGIDTQATGYSSHAEGWVTKAINTSSHVEGYNTIANGKYQHVQGKFNIADTTSAFIIGNGTQEDIVDDEGNITTQNRSNALTVDWDGNAWFAGDVSLQNVYMLRNDDAFQGEGIYTRLTGTMQQPQIEFFGTGGDEPVRLSNITYPVGDNDAVNKQYVDNTIATAATQVQIIRLEDDD